MPEALPRLAVTYTEGDTLPALSGSLKATAFEDATITLTLRRPSGNVLTKTATVASGVFTIEWAEDDLEAGIGQEALLRAELTGGDILTLLRFELDVGTPIA
jgi:hypothetical protein